VLAFEWAGRSSEKRILCMTLYGRSAVDWASEAVEHAAEESRTRRELRILRAGVDRMAGV
jgi:hypothetical protein